MKLIIACTPNGGIGYQNKLPWEKLDGDLARFKKLTTGKVIMMGRNTYESLPVKPLPNRINVVVTTSYIKGVTTLMGLPEVDKMDLSDVWLIGGAKVVNSSWHLIHEVHLTETFADYVADTFIDLVKLKKEFVPSYKETHSDHTYTIYKRK